MGYFIYLLSRIFEQHNRLPDWLIAFTFFWLSVYYFVMTNTSVIRNSFVSLKHYRRFD